MKLQATKDNLLQGLAITSHLSNKNVNLPILNNVLLKVGSKTLQLTTTNLETAIRCQVRSKIEEEGEFSVPSKLFFDCVSLLPDDKVDIELIENFLYIRCGGTETKITGISSSEFPLIPPIEGNGSYTCSVNDLKEALGQVLFAAASNESRPEISGVSLKFHDPNHGSGSLSLATTDSYRLAERVIKLQTESSSEAKDVIVPAKTLSELARIIGIFKDDVETPEQVQILVSENQIVFRLGTVELTSRTVEGTYPDYHQIIPKSFETTANASVREVAQAVKAASLFSRQGLYDVTLTFDSSSSEIRVTATDNQRGENTSVAKAEISGPNQSLVVNYRYLLDGTSAAGSDEIIFSVIDGANPCLVEPKIDESKFVYRYVVMPIKQ